MKSRKAIQKIFFNMLITACLLFALGGYFVLKMGMKEGFFVDFSFSISSYVVEIRVFLRSFKGEIFIDSRPTLDMNMSM